ncbi:MazG nucleotide pyrophosphohydrolase domain-containing protein [Paenibacillus durus]|uniref:MazG nucleotide pyrophosphohydrolase domain-containing protein n=1 Tax=Paenibacillus durus TaxID=44251 RepID=UPI0005A6A06C|nr:MazG nucleotide pyrophosphohydrolase domain-containing protein [Paenibacillus durus]
MDNITKLVERLDIIQKFSLTLYGRYDLNKSIIWMVEEMGEVVAAIRKGKSKEDITGELGDLMAWIICLGNILDIRITEALEQTFTKEMNRQLSQYGHLKYASEGPELQSHSSGVDCNNV